MIEILYWNIIHQDKRLKIRLYIFTRVYILKYFPIFQRNFGILGKMRKLCYIFMWFESMDKRGIPLVKWKTLVFPNSFRGWGFENIYHFESSL